MHQENVNVRLLAAPTMNAASPHPRAPAHRRRRRARQQRAPCSRRRWRRWNARQSCSARWKTAPNMQRCWRAAPPLCWTTRRRRWRQRAAPRTGRQALPRGCLSCMTARPCSCGCSSAASRWVGGAGRRRLPTAALHVRVLLCRCRSIACDHRGAAERRGGGWWEEGTCEEGPGLSVFSPVACPLSRPPPPPVRLLQLPRGGLRDKPGKPADYYHTCYCLRWVVCCRKVNAGYTVSKGMHLVGKPADHDHTCGCHLQPD